MELNTLMIRSVVFFVCLIVCIECSSPDWIERSIRSVQRSRKIRTHKNVDSNAIVEKRGFLNSFKDSDKASTDCCFNGGLCIMNSFCHCQKGFHGRYCEHRTRDRSCGTIEHGTWMARGCYVCHCFDGNMRCKTTQIPDCENIDFVQGTEASPDYQVDVDKKFADYERFYDVSDYDVTVPPTSSSTLPVLPDLVRTVVLMVLTVVIKHYGS